MNNTNTLRDSRVHDLRVIPRLLPALCAISLVAACAGLDDPAAPADGDDDGDGELDTAVSARDGSTWQPIGGITGPAQPRNVFQTRVFSRFVRVQLRGANYLSLAEVQVYVP